MRSGKGFVYRDTTGRATRDPAVLARIRSLAIPPAWTDVWIASNPQAHLQATGRDARGRKQYRYHPRWRQVRDDTKYARLAQFASRLPDIRARTDADLATPGLTRAKVLAAVVQLLERTLIRVGNEEYARENGSFGLTTLRDEHARVDDHGVTFRFPGKSGVRHTITLEDRRLARIVKRCQELPGQELFQYVDDDGAVQTIGSADVNEYLKEIGGAEFTAKDFRTWAGSVLAAVELSRVSTPDTRTEAQRVVVRAVENVSRRLGNTRSVCRKCYIHPAVFDAFLDGSLGDTFGELPPAPPAGLSREEMALLQLLERKTPAESTRAAG
jgi:DNA topoisomerase-1